MSEAKLSAASFSVAEILDWTGGRLANGDSIGDLRARIRVERPAPLGVSSASELAFFFSREYERELLAAAPGILITGEPFVGPMQKAGLPLWAKSAVVVCADPYFAMAILSEKFAAVNSSVAHVSGRSDAVGEIHKSAVVHPSAKLGAGVRIGPNCVIEEGAVIGARSVLYAGCFIGPKASLGDDCVLFPGVTLYEWTQVGHRARFHAGVVLGSDGFGYAPRRDGKTVIGHQKIHHLGRVVVGDDVEIGANSCVDRSTFGDTVIGDQAKLDNLVHIGHNARLDLGAIVCGGTCLAGGASVGKFAYVGGLTGIANRVHVGDGAQVGALTLITKDVPPGAAAVGNPQREYREHFRAHAALNRLLDRKRKEGST